MTLEPFQPVRLYYSIPNISAVEAKLRSLNCMFEVPDQTCWEWTFEAEALRLRVVNRLFAAEEGTPAELATMLDRDVTVIDPRRVEAELQDVRSPQDMERYLEERSRSENDVPMVEDFPLCPEEETPDFQHLATTLKLRLVRSFEHWQGNTHLTLAAIIRRTVEGQMALWVLGNRVHENPIPGQALPAQLGRLRRVSTRVSLSRTRGLAELKYTNLEGESLIVMVVDRLTVVAISSSLSICKPMTHS